MQPLFQMAVERYCHLKRWLREPTTATPHLSPSVLPHLLSLAAKLRRICACLRCYSKLYAFLSLDILENSLEIVEK
jgi:hypothetical protein